MWRFQDVNYAVASEADQAEILMRYCSVINAWPDDAYAVSYTHLDVYKRQEKTMTPNFWTNGTVEIDLSTDDNLSGVRDITLPDGSVADTDTAKYTVDKNGVYNFSVRDYCGNILSYPVEVSNIDLLAPAADYEVTVSYTHLPRKRCRIWCTAAGSRYS